MRPNGGRRSARARRQRPARQDGEAPGHAAAGPPGADMHVIFDVYTEQDENFYRAILGKDEEPANDAEE